MVFGKTELFGDIADNGWVFTNTGLKMPKLSTETERKKRQTPDLRTSTPCLQIQCCRKCGKGQ